MEENPYQLPLETSEPTTIKRRFAWRAMIVGWIVGGLVGFFFGILMSPLHSPMHIIIPGSTVLFVVLGGGVARRMVAQPN